MNRLSTLAATAVLVGTASGTPGRCGLASSTSLRDNETALTEAQQAEEAHLRARFDVFSASPESVARRRREALQDAERRFKMSRLTGEFYAAPLSRKDRNELKLLRWLYPEPKRNLYQLDGDWPDGDRLDVYRDHPFADQLLAPDGNFYPRDSKLRPAGELTISWYRQGMDRRFPPSSRATRLRPTQSSQSNH
jgi:hypothetical protein